ncbi:uncharacterized protein ACJ7VT_018564 [Polymixia lowei]
MAVSEDKSQQVQTQQIQTVTFKGHTDFPVATQLVFEDLGNKKHLETRGATSAEVLLVRSQTLDTNDGRDWNQSPAVQDMEGLKLVYDLTRPTRHADGLFTSGYSKLLGQLSAKDYLDSLIAKRVNGDLMEDQLPVKRHSDAVFTDNYSRYRNQMAVKKYLNSVLAGKRR